MGDNLGNKLTISVVICAHNEQDWIGATLDSLLGQVRMPDEVVVVNNASTDRTAEVVTEFIQAHPQLNIKLVNEPHKGLHNAREAGWRSACSDIVIATDADIRFPPKWLQIYEDAFLRDTDVVALSGPFRYYDAYPGVNIFASLFDMANQPEGIGKFFVKRYNVYGANSAYRRTALEAVNGYLEKPNGVLEDVHIGNKLHAAGMKIGFLWNNLVWHTFRRFKKDGWRGYVRYLFLYSDENVYADHLKDDDKPSP